MVRALFRLDAVATAPGGHCSCSAAPIVQRVLMATNSDADERATLVANSADAQEPASPAKLRIQHGFLVGRRRRAGVDRGTAR
jgi:hypothetical protein